MPVQLDKACWARATPRQGVDGDLDEELMVAILGSAARRRSSLPPHTYVSRPSAPHGIWLIIQAWSTIWNS